MLKLSKDISTGAYPGFSEGGGARSAKQSNKPNKCAPELL